MYINKTGTSFFNLKVLPAFCAGVLIITAILSSCRQRGDLDARMDKEADSIFFPSHDLLSKGPDKALISAKAVYKGQKTKNIALKLHYYNYVAYLYSLLGKTDSAVLYADSGILITDNHSLTDSGWELKYTSRHFTKANILYNGGRVQPAIDEFFKAKDRAEKFKNQCDANLIYHLLGLALYKQQRYDVAKQYFQRTLNIVKGCDIPSKNQYFDLEVQELISDIALCYHKQHINDSARIYYSKALKQISLSESRHRYNTDTMVNRVVARRNRGIVYGNIAQVMVKENKLDSAELYFKKSLNITNSTSWGELYDAQLTLMHLGDMYLQQRQLPKLKQTLDSLDKTLKVNKFNNEDAILGWKRLMYQYAAAYNLPLQELTYYKNYIAMRDSMATAKREKTDTDLNKELNARSQKLEISLLKKDNQLNRIYLWIVISLSVMAVVIIVLVLYNYRRSRRNVKALTQLNNQVSSQKTALEKANKDKDRILNVVAHDLRNPVGVTGFLAESMLMEESVDERTAESLTMVKRASENALGLINELLSLRADDSENMVRETTDLNQLIKSAVNLLEFKAAEKQQRLVFNPSPGLLPVLVVPERVSRVVSNLVTNAIKFSYEGKVIEIDVKRENKRALFTIRDNGVGIPQNLQANVFDMFTTSKQYGTSGEKSFGLGLSICKQIVDEHSGDISFESKVGQGTTFTVSLPLSDNV
ncbi:tetratricopeptide repeat-containing sensor histidine kinase [Mucilaginibacter mali]|uniref:histidine kinase n=1 Tax=Mucilaginibacter mali TaxID=2740462 RepID=A0A7D4QD26_9SPHI|nr:tetratricopeptide repeat-containing sensor histidine kinase [Mucilaginibacter mali]QKJ32765.1 tetratricopeptide repeat-containing sensor histidine kinase [Mucilaginibacter mali]